jgi:hypothetical protein
MRCFTRSAAVREPRRPTVRSAQDETHDLYERIRCRVAHAVGVASPRRRDPLRSFAWFCVVAGVGIALLAVSYARYETTLREEDWLQSELASGNVARLQRVLRDIDRPGHTGWVAMSPWPGVIAGVGVTACGILLLVIRRPQHPDGP